MREHRKKQKNPLILIVIAAVLLVVAVLNVVLLLSSPPRIGSHLYLTVREDADLPGLKGGDIAVVSAGVLPEIGDVALVHVNGELILAQVTDYEESDPVTKMGDAEIVIPHAYVVGTVTSHTGFIAFLTSPVLCVIAAIGAAALLFLLFALLFFKYRRDEE